MSRAALLVLYSFLLTTTLALTAPWWLWQMARTGKYREGLLERLGQVPSRLRRPEGGSIWVHAVSVGEVLAASRLVEALRAARPDTPVYVSTTTRTGQALARERFGAARVFLFPLDFAFAMRGFLRFLNPVLVVLVESEFWPRMLAECWQAAIPVAVVNARVSDRSWPRYRRLRTVWQPLLGTFAAVLAQSGQDAERLRALGAVRAVAAGNLKYDIRVSAQAPITEVLRGLLPAGVPVVVCGSTLGGEEALLLDTLPTGEIVTILAPRHPERFEEVARLCARRGLRWHRRSELRSDTATQQPSFACGAVLLLDSVGELASVYSLATVAVLGGGFLATGGHNPLEPAQFGVPVLMGPQYDNFREVVHLLRANDAVVLATPGDLAAAVRALLADPKHALAIGKRGQAVFEQQAGATDRALAALLALLPPAVPLSDAAKDPQVLRES